MKKTCLEHLEPGMVLAKDVPGADGSILLKAGTTLDGDTIGLLEESGIGSVLIKPRGEKTEPSDLLRRSEDYVRNFFLYVDPGSEVFNELFRLSVARTAKALARGWNLPCKDDIQAKNVEHMSDLFHRDQGTPEDIVGHEIELASFPDVYFKIKEVLESPASTVEDIARVVNTDVGLSVKLLRLVNSPIYGFSTTVDSVVRAVSLIGVKELSTLALGISTINFFKDIPPELIDMKTFWRHSLSCGIFGKLLASRMKGMQPERFFTAGLLHDVGRLILYKNMPYGSVQALLYARENMVPLVEAEKEILGYDHTVVSNLLLKEWQFPASLTDIITNHHAPSSASSPRDAAVIELADNMANAAEIASGGMFMLPGMTEQSWKTLGLDKSILPSLMESHDRQINEITSSFL